MSNQTKIQTTNSDNLTINKQKVLDILLSDCSLNNIESYSSLKVLNKLEIKSFIMSLNLLDFEDLKLKINNKVTNYLNNKNYLINSSLFVITIIFLSGKVEIIKNKNLFYEFINSYFNDCLNVIDSLILIYKNSLCNINDNIHYKNLTDFLNLKEYFYILLLIVWLIRSIYCKIDLDLISKLDNLYNKLLLEYSNMNITINNVSINNNFNNYFEFYKEEISMLMKHNKYIDNSESLTSLVLNSNIFNFKTYFGITYGAYIRKRFSFDKIEINQINENLNKLLNNYSYNNLNEFENKEETSVFSLDNYIFNNNLLKLKIKVFLDLSNKGIYNTKKIICLSGNQHSGKTSFAKSICHNPVIIDVDESIDVSSLIGGYIINEYGEITWNDGLLLKILNISSGINNNNNSSSSFTKNTEFQIIFRGMEKCPSELFLLFKQLITSNKLFVSLNQKTFYFKNLPLFVFIFNEKGISNINENYNQIINYSLNSSFSNKNQVLDYISSNSLNIAFSCLKNNTNIKYEIFINYIINDSYKLFLKVEYQYNILKKFVNIFPLCKDLIPSSSRLRKSIINKDYLNLASSLDSFYKEINLTKDNNYFISSKNKHKIIFILVYHTFYSLDNQENITKIFKFVYDNIFNEQSSNSTFNINFYNDSIFLNDSNNLELFDFNNNVIDIDNFNNYNEVIYSFNSITNKYIKCCNMSIVNKENILLVGQTGVGKTTMIQYLAKLMNTKLNIINLSQSSDYSDLFGGFKPVTPKAFLVKYYNFIIDLFYLHLNLEENKEFLEALNKSFNNNSNTNKSNSYTLMFVNFCLKTFAKLKDKLELIKSDMTFYDKINNKDKISESLIKIEKYKQQLIKLKMSISKGNSNNNVFAYVDGMLLETLKKDEWILLDELNLASDELLIRLKPILEGQTIFLIENDNLTAYTPGKMFRILGSMNPEYNIGKKRLPESIRSLFTELFVPQLNSLNDIKNFIVSYLPDLDRNNVNNIADFYSKIKYYQNNSSLIKANNSKSDFSLRNLSRLLMTIKNGLVFYDPKHAISQAILMNFLSQMSNESANNILKEFSYMIIASQNNTIAPYFNKKFNLEFNKNYINIMGYPIRKEYYSKPTEDLNYFIKTSMFENHLYNLLRIITMTNYAVLLEGPTSCGKTATIEYLAKCINQKIIRVNNNNNTEIEEYLGNYTSDDKGKFVFQEGFLIKAVKEGHWVILDEINLAPSEVLEALNRLLDDNRELYVPETQEILKAHPNFRIFAAMNPSETYAGRKDLSEAFKNRFIHLYYDNIPDEDLIEIIKGRLKISPKNSVKMVEVYNRLHQVRSSSKMFDNKEGFITIRDLIKWGHRIDIEIVEIAYEGYFVIAESLRNETEKIVVKNIIEDVFKIKIDLNKYYLDYIKKELPQFFNFDVNSTMIHNKIYLNNDIIRVICLMHKALIKNEPVLLVSETGCGKTLISEAYCNAINKKFIEINCHENIDTSDFLGSLRSVYGKKDKKKELKDLLIYFLSTLYSQLTMIHENNTSNSSLDKTNTLYVEERERLAKSINELLNDMNLSNNNNESDFDFNFKHQELFSNIAYKASCLKLSMPKVELSKIIKIINSINKLFEWKDGPLPVCMKEGYNIIIDEVNLALDSVLERFNSVFEKDRVLVMSEKHDEKGVETIYPVYQFGIIATMSPVGDYGKKELSPALKSRFTEIYIHKFFNDEEYIEKAELLNKSINFDYFDNLAKNINNSLVLTNNSNNNNNNYTNYDIPTYSSELQTIFNCVNSIIINNNNKKHNLIYNNNAYDNLYSIIEFKTENKFKNYNNLLRLIITKFIYSVYVWFNFHLIISTNFNEHKSLTLREVDLIINFININMLVDELDNNICNILNKVNVLLMQSMEMILLDSFYINETLKAEQLEAIKKKLILFLEIIINTFIFQLNDNRDKELIFYTFKLINNSLELIDNNKKFGLNWLSIIKSNELNTKNKNDLNNFTFETSNMLLNLNKIFRGISTKKPVLIEGSPGIGKTTIIQNICTKINKKFTRINLSEHTDIIDLIGSEYPSNENNTFVWIDGPLLTAIKDGHWVIIDEMNLASQSVLEGLNSLLDHRRSIFVPELGKKFKAHEDLLIFATQNPVNQGGGRKFLPKSFLNRFIRIYLNDLHKIDYSDILSNVFLNNRLNDTNNFHNNYINSQLIDNLTKFNYEVNYYLSERCKLELLEIGEFNLRTLIKLISNLTSFINYINNNHNVDINKRINCKEIKSNIKHVIDFYFYVLVELFYIKRLRNKQNRKFVKELFCLIFCINIENCYDNAIYDIYFKQFISLTSLNYYAVPFYNDVESIAYNNISYNNLYNKYSKYISICIKYNYPVLLTGKKNSGKKHLIKQLALKYKKSLYEFNMSSNMDSNELLGNFDKININYLIESIKDLLHQIDNKKFSFKQIKYIEESLIRISKTDINPSINNSLINKINEFKNFLNEIIVLFYNDKDNLNKITSILNKLNDIQNNMFNFEWHDSLLIKCIEKGDWIILDNANLCPSSVLDRLNSLLDDDKCIYLNECGLDENRMIVPNKEFRIFLLMNPKYGEMSRAIKNRCVELYIDIEQDINNYNNNNIALKVIPSFNINILHNKNNNNNVMYDLYDKFYYNIRFNFKNSIDFKLLELCFNYTIGNKNISVSLDYYSFNNLLYLFNNNFLSMRKTYVFLNMYILLVSYNSSNIKSNNNKIDEKLTYTINYSELELFVNELLYFYNMNYTKSLDFQTNEEIIQSTIISYLSYKCYFINTNTNLYNYILKLKNHIDACLSLDNCIKSSINSVNSKEDLYNNIYIYYISILYNCININTCELIQFNLLSNEIICYNNMFNKIISSSYIIEIIINIAVKLILKKEKDHKVNSCIENLKSLYFNYINNKDIIKCNNFIIILFQIINNDSNNYFDILNDLNIKLKNNIKDEVLSYNELNYLPITIKNDVFTIFNSIMFEMNLINISIESNSKINFYNNMTNNALSNNNDNKESYNLYIAEFRSFLNLIKQSNNENIARFIKKNPLGYIKILNSIKNKHLSNNNLLYNIITNANSINNNNKIHIIDFSKLNIIINDKQVHISEIIKYYSNIFSILNLFNNNKVNKSTSSNYKLFYNKRDNTLNILDNITFQNEQNNDVCLNLDDNLRQNLFKNLIKYYDIKMTRSIVSPSNTLLLDFNNYEKIGIKYLVIDNINKKIIFSKELITKSFYLIADKIIELLNIRNLKNSDTTVIDILSGTGILPLADNSINIQNIRTYVSNSISSTYLRNTIQYFDSYYSMIDYIAINFNLQKENDYINCNLLSLEEQILSVSLYNLNKNSNLYFLKELVTIFTNQLYILNLTSDKYGLYFFSFLLNNSNSSSKDTNNSILNIFNDLLFNNRKLSLTPLYYFYIKDLLNLLESNYNDYIDINNYTDINFIKNNLIGITNLLNIDVDNNLLCTNDVNIDYIINFNSTLISNYWPNEEDIANKLGKGIYYTFYKETLENNNISYISNLLSNEYYDNTLFNNNANNINNLNKKLEYYYLKYHETAISDEEWPVISMDDLLNILKQLKDNVKILINKYDNNKESVTHNSKKQELIQLVIIFEKLIREFIKKYILSLGDTILILSVLLLNLLLSFKVYLNTNNYNNYYQQLNIRDNYANMNNYISNISCIKDLQRSNDIIYNRLDILNEINYKLDEKKELNIKQLNYASKSSISNKQSTTLSKLVIENTTALDEITQKERDKIKDEEFNKELEDIFPNYDEEFNHYKNYELIQLTKNINIKDFYNNKNDVNNSKRNNRNSFKENNVQTISEDKEYYILFKLLEKLYVNKNNLSEYISELSRKEELECNIHTIIEKLNNSFNNTNISDLEKYNFKINFNTNLDTLLDYVRYLNYQETSFDNNNKNSINNLHERNIDSFDYNSYLTNRKYLIYNFYKDENYEELKYSYIPLNKILVKINSIIEQSSNTSEIEDLSNHPLLYHICTICFNLLELDPVSTSLSKMITGLDILIDKLILVKKHIPSTLGTIDDELYLLMSVIRRYRKIEISSWKCLLNNRTLNIEQEDIAVNFKLIFSIISEFELMINESLNSLTNKDIDNNIFLTLNNKISKEIQNILDSINAFIISSNTSNFKSRLSLLLILSNLYLNKMNNLSENNNNLNDIINELVYKYYNILHCSLSNSYNYYYFNYMYNKDNKFMKFKNIHLKDIEDKVADLKQIAKWDIKNYYNFKDNMKRNSKQLTNIFRTYDNICKLEIKSFLDFSVKCFIDKNYIFNNFLTEDEILDKAELKDNKKNNANIEIDNNSTISNTLENINMFESINTEIFNRIEFLKSPDSNRVEYKKRALIDLIKRLKELGVKKSSFYSSSEAITNYIQSNNILENNEDKNSIYSNVSNFNKQCFTTGFNELINENCLRLLFKSLEKFNLYYNLKVFDDSLNANYIQQMKGYSNNLFYISLEMYSSIKNIKNLINKYSIKHIVFNNLDTLELNYNMINNLLNCNHFFDNKNNNIIYYNDILINCILNSITIPDLVEKDEKLIKLIDKYNSCCQYISSYITTKNILSIHHENNKYISIIGFLSVLVINKFVFPLCNYLENNLPQYYFKLKKSYVSENTKDLNLNELLITNNLIYSNIKNEEHMKMVLNGVLSEGISSYIITKHILCDNISYEDYKNTYSQKHNCDLYNSFITINKNDTNSINLNSNKVNLSLINLKDLENYLFEDSYINIKKEYNNSLSLNIENLLLLCSYMSDNILLLENNKALSNLFYSNINNNRMLLMSFYSLNKIMYSVIKLSYVAMSIFYNVSINGFCPSNSEVQDNNKSMQEKGNQLQEGGHGMADGEGYDNISKEIEDEEQLLGLRDDTNNNINNKTNENKENKNNDENKDNGFEIDEDFNADYEEDVPNKDDITKESQEDINREKDLVNDPDENKLFDKDNEIKNDEKDDLKNEDSENKPVDLRNEDIEMSGYDDNIQKAKKDENLLDPNKDKEKRKADKPEDNKIDTNEEENNKKENNLENINEEDIKLDYDKNMLNNKEINEDKKHEEDSNGEEMEVSDNNSNYNNLSKDDVKEESIREDASYKDENDLEDLKDVIDNNMDIDDEIDNNKDNKDLDSSEGGYTISEKDNRANSIDDNLSDLENASEIDNLDNNKTKNNATEKELGYNPNTSKSGGFGNKSNIDNKDNNEKERNKDNSEKEKEEEDVDSFNKDYIEDNINEMMNSVFQKQPTINYNKNNKSSNKINDKYKDLNKELQDLIKKNNNIKEDFNFIESPGLSDDEDNVEQEDDEFNQGYVDDSNNINKENLESKNIAKGKDSANKKEKSKNQETDNNDNIEKLNNELNEIIEEDIEMDNNINDNENSDDDLANIKSKNINNNINSKQVDNIKKADNNNIDLHNISDDSINEENKEINNETNNKQNNLQEKMDNYINNTIYQDLNNNQNNISKIIENINIINSNNNNINTEDQENQIKESNIEDIKKKQVELIQEFNMQFKLNSLDSNNNSIDYYLKKWNDLESISQHLINKISENLKIALEPNKQTKLKGNFRTGKRLNLKKIISFIASNYRNDKIWLRRSLPSERNYMITIAIDDSYSMRESNKNFFAIETLVIFANSFKRAGLNKFNICSIRDNLNLLHSMNDDVFSKEKGAFILNKFKFDYKDSKSHDYSMRNFILDYNNLAENNNLNFSVNNSKNEQICFILSDGIFNKDIVRPACLEAKEKGIIYVFIILDEQSKDDLINNKLSDKSILNMNSVYQVYDDNGDLNHEIKPYLEDFPFSLFVVLKKSSDLPDVINDILLKWMNFNKEN